MEVFRGPTRRSCLAGAGAVALSLGGATPGLAGPRFAMQFETYRSRGARIPVEVAGLDGPSRRAAVILAHGLAGIGFYSARFEGLERRLTERGYAVFTPHYFAATGHEAQPDLADENILAWAEALGDAVAFVARHPGVDAARIGYAGFSLGANLGGIIAGRGAPIAALASNYAGISRHFPANAARMPPTLMIHARRDPVVELASVERYRDRLRELGAAPELKVFDSADHILEGAQWNESIRLMLRFFERRLARG